jgi:hypothetical protein
MKSYRADKIFINDWNQLSIKRFMKVLPLLPKSQHHEGKLHLLAALCKKSSVFKKLNPYQVVDLFEVLEFLEKPFCNFVIPMIKIRFKKYFAPKPLLSNTSFLQFISADTYFTKFIHTQDEVWLNKLICCLYLPANSTFSSDLVENNLLKLSGIKNEYKQIILFNFAQSLNKIKLERPHIFPRMVEDEDFNPTPINQGAMYQSLLYDLAEMPVFGSYEQTKNSNALVVLDYLEKKAKENVTKKSKAV